MVTTGQLALLIVAILLFAGGMLVSLSRVWGERAGQKAWARVLNAGGIAVCLMVVAWHAQTRGAWLPLGDNFDTLVWLGLLLGAFLLYVQSARPVGGLEWFVLPVVILLLVGAGIFGSAKPHDYVLSTWAWVHHVTAYTSFIAFAVAFAVGALYLINHRRLRNKKVLAGPNLGSLERLEHLAVGSVTMGFALLTVGLATGLVIVMHQGQATTMGPQWFAAPKVWLAALVWLVYAVVLHAPINPSFRGRKAAILSVVGFVLMIGTLVAVQFMPEAG